jgi:Ice-binding-like
MLGLWFLFALPGVQGGSLLWIRASDPDQLWPEKWDGGIRQMFSWDPFAYEDTGFDSGVSVPTISPEIALNRAPQTFRAIRLDENQTITISGAPGETVTLNLRSFALYDNAILTLQGTATTTFIINVRHRFSLSGNARVTLAGGVQWDDVFFNVIGKGSVVTLSGNASLEGILTAKKRKIRLSGHADIFGEVFAKKLRLAGNAEIIQPPVVSP